MRCLGRATWGFFFLFCLFFCPSVLSLFCVDGLTFPHPGLPLCRCPRIRSQLAHTALTGPVTRLASVRFPALSQKPHTGFSLFGSFTLYLSPTGKDWPVTGTALSRFAGFAHNCPTRLEQGGEPVLLVSFPYPVFKTAHRATQRQVLFHRFFFACLCSGRASKSRFRL